MWRNSDIQVKCQHDSPLFNLYFNSIVVINLEDIRANVALSQRLLSQMFSLYQLEILFFSIRIITCKRVGYINEERNFSKNFQVTIGWHLTMLFHTLTMYWIALLKERFCSTWLIVLGFNRDQKKMSMIFSNELFMEMYVQISLEFSQLHYCWKEQTWSAFSIQLTKKHNWRHGRRRTWHKHFELLEPLHFLPMFNISLAKTGYFTS